MVDKKYRNVCSFISNHILLNQIYDSLSVLTKYAFDSGNSFYYNFINIYFRQQMGRLAFNFFF